MYNNYKECLYNGGLNRKIKIIGKTPKLGTTRKDEILKWIEDNGYNGDYIILDDKNILGLEDRLIKCNAASGITYDEFLECINKLSRNLTRKSVNMKSGK